MMKTKYTKAYILSNRGCRSRDKVLSMDFMVDKNYTYSGIIDSNDLTLLDKFWWVIKKTNLTKDQKLDIAIRCAETVLPIFEDKYPNDDRPRKAIETAKNRDAFSSSAADDAADAAYAAAADAFSSSDAADAAFSAADAAFSYAYAAYAASDAAYAYAAYAAYAAADAADAAAYAKYKERLIKILKSPIK